MKDLDKLLASRGNPKPQRPLRADFTDRTIDYIKAHPRPTGLVARLKEHFTMKLKLHKPATAFAAAALTLVIGGTAYAAFNWPAITSVFRNETILPNGNRVVAIGTENCRYFGEPDPKSPTAKSHYYEVRKNSGLTNEQAAQMIQGLCEEDRNNGTVNPLLEQLSKSGKNVLVTQSLLIKSISNDKITVAPDPQYDLTMHYAGEVTYTLTDQAKAYDGSNSVQLSTLKVGDTIMMVFNDRHAVNSEGDVNDPNHYDDPSLLDTLALVRVPALTGSPDAFYKNLGKAFVRTEPCTANPAGFCRVYEFDDKQ